jgi:ABC-type phosphate/phosphonate transport system permease subunit
MSVNLAPPRARALGASAWRRALAVAIRCVVALLGLAIVVQAFIVVQARPQDLITGVHGMADLIRRAMPPDFSQLPSTLWPALQTVDIALFGTLVGIIIALPLALLASANMTPSRFAYYAARALIGFTRAVTVVCDCGRAWTLSGRLSPWRAFSRHARPAVRGDDRANGYGANSCA